MYQVQACTQEEVDACFKAAKEAGNSWAKVCSCGVQSHSPVYHDAAACARRHHEAHQRLIRPTVQTPLWKRAEYLHKVAHSLKENAKVSCFVSSWGACRPTASAARATALKRHSVMQCQALHGLIRHI